VGPGPVIALTAVNASGTGRKNLTLTVQYNSGTIAPVITSTNSASGTVGQAFNFPETASGSPTLWTIAPSMSDGLSFNGADGTVTGTPTSAGTYNYTVAAYNNGGVGQQPLQLTFTSPLAVPVISSPATATATNGRAFSYRITASGSPTSYAASNRPAWLGAPNAQGIMSGTPTATGSANLTLYASNAAGRGHAPLALSIVVNPSVAAPTITSTNSASGTVGQAFAFTFRASGGTPITWSVAPPLPANLTLNTSSGAVTGTNQVSGTNIYTVTASNAGGTNTQAWTLGVAPLSPPVITSAGAASGRVGTVFRYTITASNFPTSFQASNRPAWLSAPNAQGVMSGTPPTALATNITLYASNAAGRGHANLAITITSPVVAPVITSTGAVTATQSVAFSYQIRASGSPTSYNAAPLPPGLSVNTVNGLISGTPQSVGSSTVVLSASNAAGVGTKNLVLTVTNKGAVPVITSANTATGTNGVAFRYQITASGSPTSYAAADLPPGLTVNTKSGLISGTPKRAGTNQVMLTASNRFGPGSAQMILTIQANAAVPEITNDPGVLLGRQGYQFTPFTIRASGTPAPTYGVSNLPAGLTVNPVTGVISGTPTRGGFTLATLTAANRNGTGTDPVAFIIEASPPVQPKITSNLDPVSLVRNSSYNYQITANNDPTVFGASGLPPGLRINPTTGVISGRPTRAGTYSVRLEATRRVPGERTTTASGIKLIQVRGGGSSNPPNTW